MLLCIAFARPEVEGGSDFNLRSDVNELNEDAVTHNNAGEIDLEQVGGAHVVGPRAAKVGQVARPTFHS